MINFSGIVTPSSIAFSSPQGKTINVTSAHPHFDKMRETMKALQAALKGNDEAETRHLHQVLTDLAEPARTIEASGNGKVTVSHGVVHYDGEPIHNAITERILWGLGEGYDMDAYVAFLENLMENPSKRAVTELYGFIEKHKMGITPDGHILGYKKVTEDYRDIHSRTFDNKPGTILEMPRNKVDDDKDRTCSTGFHFCAFSYLPSFGSGKGDRVVLVKVNPRDVVSIPSDYNDAKARTCRYEVVGEYEGDDLEDILSQKPVFTEYGSYKSDDADLFGDENDEDERSWFDEDTSEDQDELDFEDADEDEDEDEDEDDRIVQDAFAEEAAPSRAITGLRFDLDTTGTTLIATVSYDDGAVEQVTSPARIKELSDQFRGA